MDYKLTNLFCVAAITVALVALGLLGLSWSKPELVARESPGIAPLEFIIIDQRIDVSGIIILDYAFDGIQRTAYFYDDVKLTDYIEYLRSVGTVTYMGATE